MGLKKKLAAPALLLGAILPACKSSSTLPNAGPATSASPSSAATTAASKSLLGAGATFPAPLYQKWASEYKTKFGVEVNYQAIGSGAGITQITNKVVDFGASDAPMKDEELAKAPAPLLHIPMVFGAVTVTYNLNPSPATLKLTGPVLSDIFQGTIKKWNAPAIAALNPGAKLPAADITVVHRSDGSGTTNLFTSYLSTVSPGWKAKVGAGKDVAWPVGLGGKGNDGVTALVKQNPGAVGYVEVAYAKANSLPLALIKNKAGEFIAPDIPSITAAAAGAQVPDDLRFSVVDSAGAGAYPIAGATWLLVYKDQADAAQGKALVDFLWWAIHDGQLLAPSLTYAPLPKELVAKAEAKISSMTTQGHTIRSA